MDEQLYVLNTTNNLLAHLISQGDNDLCMSHRVSFFVLTELVEGSFRKARANTNVYYNVKH